MLLVAGAERLELPALRHLPHQPRARRQLVVEADAAEFHRLVALQLDVERGIRRVPDAGAGLAFVLEVPEEMQLVAEEWTAERKRDLLIVDRHHAIQDRIIGVEAAVPEVAADRSGEGIGSGAGDGAHLHARRPAHRGIEPVRNELKLRDRFLAVARLAAEAPFGCDLLTVERELEFALLSAVPDPGTGVLAVSDVMRLPGASMARAIQLRPCTGNSCTCRGSILPPRLDVETLINGASADTVTVSWTVDGGHLQY